MYPVATIGGIEGIGELPVPCYDPFNVGYCAALGIPYGPPKPPAPAPSKPAPSPAPASPSAAPASSGPSTEVIIVGVAGLVVGAALFAFYRKR